MDKTNFKKYIYSLTSAVFVILILTVFFVMVRFLLSQASQIFQTDEEFVSEQVVKYDMERFQKIKKRIDPEMRKRQKLMKEEETQKTLKQKSQENQQLDKNSISIQILNGKGVAGLAAKTKNSFTKLGFNVSSIGNAPRTDDTTLKIKDSKKDFINMIKEVSKTSGFEILNIQNIKEENKYDVIIILGIK